jgi:hypothetical protein
MSIEEVPRQLQDVIPAGAKRRHLHVDSIQPVVQVQPEAAMLDHLGERTVRGHDDPGVDVADAAAADALDREILNRAQKLGLRGR